jgi:beta-phosphoglucomutase-like phosphatase (HAD superfamily)
MAPPIAVLDVDGTLVDTNYHHAIAWYRSFREHGLTVPVWRVHRHIGMGGDQLVGAVAVYHSIVELRNSLDEWLTS